MPTFRRSIFLGYRGFLDASCAEVLFEPTQQSPAGRAGLYQGRNALVFDDLDAAPAHDAAAATAPGQEQRDQVDEEPDGDALILFWIYQDQHARDQQGDDDGDDVEG